MKNYDIYDIAEVLYESTADDGYGLVISTYTESSFKSTLQKDFKPKGQKKLSDFKTEKIDKSFITKYKNTKLLKYINPEDTAYAFMDNDKLVAIVAVDLSHKDTEHNWITAIEVTNDYKGYGLAKQLLDYAVKQLHGNALAVQNDNDIAKHTYEKYGFKASKESIDDVRSGRSKQLYMYL